MKKTYTFMPIGVIHSPFKEKFGIPRRPRLAEEVISLIELSAPYNDPTFIKGLEGFSHLWLLFIFHAPKHENWNPSVRPPRLGGNKRLGVFATRSPFRPNPIGMSAVALEKIEIKKNKIYLHVRGADLLDQTPILDIKPYIKDSDIVLKAKKGWTENLEDKNLRVSFSKKLQAFIRENLSLKKQLIQIIKQDPRPRYQENKNNEESYAFHFDVYDVHFKISGTKALVTDIFPKDEK